MATEIERKFLLNPALLPANMAFTFIRQGYVFVEVDKSLRVRQYGQKAFLTLKGKDQKGMRPEFEYEIPFDDSKYLLDKLCIKGVIAKKRYVVQWEGHRWEIDEFLDDNEGLWLAEVELESPDEEVAIPPWVTAEVTGEEKYLNSFIVQHPYSTWVKK